MGNANQGGKRQVTLLSKETWEERIKELGLQTDPIARRANLLISGLELANSRTRIINIGSCQIKIWGETKPCEVMDKVHPGLQDALRHEWGGGAFGEVLNDGEIAVGDEVSWVIDNS